MVDKSFVEIEALYQVYPRCYFIICAWHARQTIKKYANSLHLTSEAADRGLKQKIISLFEIMLTGATEEVYLEAWADMSGIRCQNPIDQGEIDTFLDYFNENWHSHNSRWSFMKLKKLELKNNFTNNRSENVNAQIKKRVERQKQYIV